MKAGTGLRGQEDLHGVTATDPSGLKMIDVTITVGDEDEAPEVGETDHGRPVGANRP